MAILLQVLQIVLPVFLTVSVGSFWVWSGRDFPTEFVTQIATKIAVPALVVVVLMRSELDQSAVTAMFWASLGAYAAALALFFVFCKAMGFDLRTYLAPLTFNNTGNLGLPLALFAFGEAELEFAIVVFAVTSVLSFTLGIALVSGSFSARRIAQEPIVWGTILGTVLLYTGYDLPNWLAQFLDLIGQLAIPLVLITLGVSLARLKGQGFGQATWLSALKIGASAALGWAMAMVFGLSPLATSVLVLQMATPFAVTSFMLASLYDAEPDKVATLVITSTLMSVVTLPILLGILL